MSRLKSLLASPKYTFMRGPARFSWIRRLVAGVKRASGKNQAGRYERQLIAARNSTLFSEIALDNYVEKLREAGCSFGLKLPAELVEEIRDHAESTPAYAFRDPKLGFLPGDRAKAETIVGKEILLAQHFNVQTSCSAISRIASDPVINWIALKYVGCVPRYLGANLWWTFPVNSNRADRIKHAHFFHRDIDDFRFLKFFFYITDVEKGDGGHWVVTGSHKKSPHVRLKDRLLTRRFADDEIGGFYDKSDIVEVVGSSGEGFAEDTLCVHKGATPLRNPRLILQFQFGLFGLVPENDVRSTAELQRIC